MPSTATLSTTLPRAPASRARSPLAWLLAALALLTVWRVLAALHAAPPLFFDEAQYWDWSRHPDWGYFSKPPMVAWLIALSTGLLGHSEPAVRAAAFLLYPATAWLIYLVGRRLAGHYPPSSPTARHGPWLAALLFASLPMTAMGTWLITTDAPLLFFWSAALLFYLRALADDRGRDWLALGLALGLGLLSKYSMALFIPAALGHLLASPDRRRLLAAPGPWLAAALALAVLSPNLAWNLQHDFASFRHTAEISQLDRALLHPDKLLDFVLAQFAVFGPLAMAALAWLARRPGRLLGEPALAPLAWFALLPLALFLVQALLARAFANWAVTAYVAAAPLVAFWLLSRGRRTWLAAAIAVNLVLGAAAYHWHDLARWSGVELGRRTDPYSRLLGWPEVGGEVARRLAAHPGARLLTHDRTEYCELAYYAGPRARPAYYLNPSRAVSHHYALTADVAGAPSGEFLLVSDSRRPETLTVLFAEARELAPIQVAVYPDLGRHYRTFLVRDFRGYP